jgi:deazaflavin-dependent oxidoreductase (nitroreductase family)
VRGRTTGEVRQTPVNVLDLDGDRFLVAPRGETQWVRNIRVTPEAELRVGRRVERVVAHELADSEKLDVLRAYLTRWKFEVGAFFDGVDGDSTDEELARIAPAHPVFRLQAVHTDALG